MPISTRAAQVQELNSYAPALDIKLSLAIKLQGEQVRTNKDLNMMNKNRDKKSGFMLEQAYLKATQYLEGVEDAWLAKSGSALDNDAKVDLVIVPELEEAATLTEKEKDRLTRALCVQIKTTLEQGWEHLSLDSVMGGMAVPGVVIDDAPYGRVIQLHRVTNISYTAQFKAIMTIAHLHKGKTVPVMAVKYAREIVTLGLARYANFGEDLIFIPDPIDP